MFGSNTVYGWLVAIHELTVPLVQISVDKHILTTHMIQINGAKVITICDVQFRPVKTNLLLRGNSMS